MKLPDKDKTFLLKNRLLLFGWKEAILKVAKKITNSDKDIAQFVKAHQK
jgi:hypothetical protein